MAQGEDASAQLRVLTNPDLVHLILGKLDGLVPVLSLDRKDCRYLTDRWAAGQVNRAFRQAALRLPWEARLDSSQPGIDADTLALICGPRNLASAGVWLQLPRSALASCAALLCHASSVEELEVSFYCEGSLLAWLQHTQGAGPCQGLSVQSCLSLSQLTRLTVGRGSMYFHDCSWSSGSWLTAVSGLRKLKLYSYIGPPLGSLPCLQSLEVIGCRSNRRTPEQEAQHALEEWAQPRLTTLTLEGRRLRIGSSASCSAEQGWHARLGQLQHLSLVDCLLSVQGTGFLGQVPVLTHLELIYCHKEGARDLGVVFPTGLPSSLEELHINNRNNRRRVLQSAYSVLKKLCSLELADDPGTRVDDDDEVAAARQSLTALPNLKQAYWAQDLEDHTYVHSWYQGDFSGGYEC